MLVYFYIQRKYREKEDMDVFNDITSVHCVYNSYNEVVETSTKPHK